MDSELTWPAVSAVVNTYNRADLLPRALASVLAQRATFPDFEVIVVDDASTDSTADVIREWAGRFDGAGIPFRAFRLGENSGYQAVPKNRAIEFARGDFVRFLDDDNEWTPGSLKALVDAALAGDVWPDVVYGRREYVMDPRCTNADLPTGPSPFTPHDPARLAESPTFNYIDTGDALIARGVFWWLYEHTTMMWNESWRRFGDWELFCRMANLEKLVGAVSPRFKAVDAIVQRYHWTGTNLQLTRPFHETPRPKSAITGEMYK
jgi:glycosyltransferase involved in cell wall biosynthesis